MNVIKKVWTEPLKHKKVLLIVGTAALLFMITLTFCLVIGHYEKKTEKDTAVMASESSSLTTVTETQIQTTVTESVVTVEAVTAETQPAKAEPVLVKMNISSIERDLKIKIQNKKGKNIKGVKFSVFVRPELSEEKAALYEDKDKDGIIYLTDLESGDYLVELKAADGYYTENAVVKATVKAKIEYTAVDIADEIKTEEEVAPSEDSQKQEIREEAEVILKDTVEWLVSDCNAKTVRDASFLDKSRYIEKSETGENITVNLQESSEDCGKVSMPATGKIYISKEKAAGELSLKLEIEESEEVVDKQAVCWSCTGDASEGIKLSKTTGESITVTALENAEPGTATVTAVVPFEESAEKKNVSLECTITLLPETYRKKEPLLDIEGKTLYLDVKCKNKATAGDWLEKGVRVFYADPVYTGWQTWAGKLYYFDAKGNPVTGNQVIGGIKYVFDEKGVLQKGNQTIGIDVSKWQGNINWSEVKAAGVSFAIIRVGYRGPETGVLVEDSFFKKNIKGASDAGIKIGVYFFSQAITQAEAVEEASMVLGLTSGYNLSYPIFIDSENGVGNARANGLDKETRTACVEAFCKTITNAGQKAGVYASKNWFQSRLDTKKLEHYCIWVAQYRESCNYPGKYNIWQYTSSGNIPGIKGRVDLNISYMQ